MKKSILILTLISISFFSCKKDPKIPFCELNPDECVDVREVKDYFYFKLGSYWVYEEENTGMRDSVYVMETFSDTGAVIFSTSLQSTYDGYDYRFWTKGVTPSTKNNIAKKSEKSTRVVRSKTKPGDFVAEATCFIFYPKTGMWTYTEGGGYIVSNVLRIDTIYNTFTVATNIFKDVVVISEDHTAIEESQLTIHYYTKGVGLIKKELIDSNQIWNLVDYHIKN